MTNSQACRRWRQNHPEAFRASRQRCDARRYQEHAQRLRRYKERPCTDCGVAYPYYVMQFDHLGGKSFALGKGHTRSWPAIAREIAKCDVVCANCHAERTHQRREAKVSTP